MRIGELAGRTGLSRDAIRYYERVGVLAPAPRGPNGYRDYPEDAVNDVQFVRKARSLGLELREVRDILAISAAGESPCDHVRATIRQRLSEIDARIAGLEALRGILRGVLELRPDPAAVRRASRCAMIDSVSVS